MVIFDIVNIADNKKNILENVCSQFYLNISKDLPEDFMLALLT